MFDWLFNYPKTDFDAGAVTFASSLSSWLLVALILLAAVVLGFSMWRRRDQLSAAKLWTIGLLQLAVAGILLTLIWQPTLRVATISAGENTVATLLDSSASMQVESSGESRYQQALETLSEDLVPELQQHFTVKTATFGSDLTWTDDLSTDNASADQRSNIAGALIHVLDQARVNPLSAVVIATDGSDNSNSLDEEFWNTLASYNVPIHTIGVGQTSLLNDTEVTAVDMPSEAAPGSIQTARVTVRHGEQKALRVKVYSGDDIIAIKDQELSGTPGQSSLDIEIDAAEAGLAELRFEAEPQPGDISPGNNNRKHLLQVQEQQRKILYFEGEPRWEYKFIRRAMHQAPAISLVTILRTTPNKFYRQGIESPEQHATGFPNTKKDLYTYDAVIIGNVESISLNATQQQLLHDYVSERGGTLMMLAGDNALSDGGWQSSAVASALPVSLQTQQRKTFNRSHAKVELASAGNYSPITRFSTDIAENQTLWDSLPELADFQNTGAAKPGANVLLNAIYDGQSHPLLTHQRYGAGNTYLLATSGTWRWQMQLPSEDQHHETFWRQLLQSIAASAPQQMQTNTDRQIYRDENQIEIATRLLDQEFQPLANTTVEAVLTSPDGTQKNVVLNASADEAGVYSASTEAALPGSWQIDIQAQQQDGTEISSATKWIYREDGTAEQYALAQNDTFLKRVSSATGGNYYAIEDASDITSTLRAARAGIVREQSLPLWNAPFFFLLLIGLKLTEWFLRMFWGRL